MAHEFLKPMLDVGSPRVFNVNVMSKRLVAKDPAAQLFFQNKPLNNLVLIKDMVPESEAGGATTSIGTKLYIPFNENDIYEGGRTIFFHDRHLEAALKSHFGETALGKDTLPADLRVIGLLDKLPSLDPFLLKDVFLNAGLSVNDAYFEVSQEIWREIESFILQRLEPLANAAFPEAMSSDDVARQLVEKIWEARDLVALQPLIQAFRLPPGEELEIFSSWKGINFYAFQYQRAKPQMGELMIWLRDLKIPFAAVSASDRAEVKENLEWAKTQLRNEWQKAEVILQEYQVSYDRMFKQKISSVEFLTFLKKSRNAYWDLGNSLGKAGHATYCWNAMTNRYKERKLGWEQMREVLKLLAKIFQIPKKSTTAVSWS
ncbi:MAG: hypothetical protein ABTQ34_01265 [Bdellovibrionales bacterium]